MATKGKYLKLLLLVLSLPAIVIWPYTQAYPASQENRVNACGKGCCCCAMAIADTKPPLAGCGCRVGSLPNFPNPQDGLDHPDMSRQQLPQTSILEFSQLPLPDIKNDRGTDEQPENVSNSPPLYILNSTFLI